MLESGERLRAVMTYFEDPDERHRIGSVFEAALDSVLEQDPDAEIHVLAYSLGSIVALDALWPDTSYPGPRRGIDKVASLTTLGCPVEMVRMLYPDHFLRPRRSGVADLPSVWHNVQIPVDLLASSLSAWPTTPEPAPPPGVAPATRARRRAAGSRHRSSARALRRRPVKSSGSKASACTRSTGRSEDPRYLRAEPDRWLP